MFDIGPSFMNSGMNPGMMKRDPNRLGNERMKPMMKPPMNPMIAPQGPKPMPKPLGADPAMQAEFKRRMGGNTGIAGTMFGNNPRPGQPLPQIQGPGMGNVNPAMMPSPEVLMQLLQMFSRIRGR